MTYREFVDHITSFMRKATDLIVNVPRDTALYCSKDNASGMQFYAGVPVSMFPLVTTPAEETTVRATNKDYFDTRTAFYWTKSSGAWVSVPYIGQKPFLRKYCLVLGSNNSKLFLHGEPGFLHPIDTSSTIPV